MSQNSPRIFAMDTFQDSERNDNFVEIPLLNPRNLEGGQIEPPPLEFLVLNFCSFTDHGKLWHNNNNNYFSTSTNLHI